MVKLIVKNNKSARERERTSRAQGDNEIPIKHARKVDCMGS